MAKSLFDRESWLQSGSASVEEVTAENALAYLARKNALDLAPILGLVEPECRGDAILGGEGQ